MNQQELEELRNTMSDWLKDQPKEVQEAYSDHIIEEKEVGA